MCLSVCVDNIIFLAEMNKKKCIPHLPQDLTPSPHKKLAEGFYASHVAVLEELTVSW